MLVSRLLPGLSAIVVTVGSSKIVGLIILCIMPGGIPQLFWKGTVKKEVE